jgi:predicted O-methyltransferase YrrM
MLEIGSYEGASTCWLLEHLTDHPGTRLTCVDQWAQRSGQRVYQEDMETVYQTFLKNIRATDKANRVTVLRGSTREVLPGIQDQRFDLIYIDGDHSAEGVYYDSLQAFRLVHDGGMILWDDYHHAASVKEGVDRACRETGVTLRQLGKNVYCIK